MYLLGSSVIRDRYEDTSTVGWFFPSTLSTMTLVVVVIDLLVLTLLVTEGSTTARSVTGLRLGLLVVRSTVFDVVVSSPLSNVIGVNNCLWVLHLPE